MPTLNARPENFLIDDYDYRTTEADDRIIITEDAGVPVVVQNIANNREGPDENIPPDPSPYPPYPLPDGQFYLVTDSGAFLVTDSGSFLIGGGP